MSMDIMRGDLGCAKLVWGILRVISLDISLNEYMPCCLPTRTCTVIHFRYQISLSTFLILKEAIIQVQVPKIYIHKLVTFCTYFVCLKLVCTCI
jgi:hypothetical protein